MNENIKIGLLGVIALTVVINTFFMDDAPISRDMQNNTVASSASEQKIKPLTPQTPPPTQLPILSERRAKTGIKFTDVSHNFGTIKQDSKNTKIFKFTNTGSEPLIIEAAKGSCGCTVPKFPKEPILPSESGDIEVVYSPGKQQGKQNKNVTITANTDPIKTVINIFAEVEVAEL